MANYDADEDERTSYDHTSPRPQTDLIEKLINPQPNYSDFLNTISQIESSGGKNMNHPVVQSGIQQGDHAIGQYGLMPNTISELLRRQQMSNSRGPASVDDGQVMQTNAGVEKQLANQLADKVLNKYQDPNMAAYAWHMGHNLTPDQVQQRDYQNDPYVQKFQQIRKSLGYK